VKLTDVFWQVPDDDHDDDVGRSGCDDGEYRTSLVCDTQELQPEEEIDELNSVNTT
jgi:hypothetical protein